MSKTNSKNHENDHQALFDELEKRYGCAMAQGIVDEIKKTEDSDNAGAPDYMLVKACSEMLELFRGEAQTLISQMKMRPRVWSNTETNVTYLDQRRLEKEFKRIFRLYWVSMKLFYPMYDDAMNAARKPKFAHRSTVPQALAA